MANSKTSKINENTTFTIAGVAVVIAGMNVIMLFVENAKGAARIWGVVFGIVLELAGALLIGTVLGKPKRVAASKKK